MKNYKLNDLEKDLEKDFLNGKYKIVKLSKKYLKIKRNESNDNKIVYIDNVLVNHINMLRKMNELKIMKQTLKFEKRLIKKLRVKL